MKNLSETIRMKMVNEYMGENKVWDIFEEMKEALGAEELLHQIAQALTTKELEDNLRYIDRMNDLGMFK